MSVLLLTMGPQLGITADLPVVGVGGAGVIRFRPIGAIGSVKWTLVDSALPAEWDSALNPDGDAVTLTTADAETPGTFSVTVRAVDNARIPVVRSFDVRVMALPLTISGSFPGWTQGEAVTGSLTISGGVQPYSDLTIAAGAIPAGVSLSIVGSSVVASGVPSGYGAWSATVLVRDSASTPAQIALSGDVEEFDPREEIVEKLLYWYSMGTDGYDAVNVWHDNLHAPTGSDWLGNRFGRASATVRTTNGGQSFAGSQYCRCNATSIRAMGSVAVRMWCAGASTNKIFTCVGRNPNPFGAAGAQYNIRWELSTDSSGCLKYRHQSGTNVNNEITSSITIGTTGKYFVGFDRDDDAKTVAIIMDAARETHGYTNSPSGGGDSTVYGFFGGVPDSSYDGIQQVVSLQDVMVFSAPLSAGADAWLYNSGAGRSYSEVFP